MRILIGLWMLSACGPGSVEQIDASGPTAPDSAPPGTGLYVAWIASPVLPGQIKSDLTVTSASFQVARIQALGDAGGATGAAFDLNWNPGPPVPTPMLGAQSGIYSKVTVDIDGGFENIAYVIRGTCKVQGNVRDYEIHDRNDLSIDVEVYALTLQPGSAVTMAIKIDLRDALDAVNFASLDHGDTLVLDTSDPQMSLFRDNLRDAFGRGN